MCLLGRWDGTHFGWPCSLVHGSGQMCLGLVVVSWGCLKWVPGRPSIRDSWMILEPQGTVPQALTLYGGVGFIARCLSPPFSGECPRGSRCFWNRRACVGFDPAPGPTLKRPCAIFVWLMGRTIPGHILRLFSWAVLYSCRIGHLRSLSDSRLRLRYLLVGWLYW